MKYIVTLHDWHVESNRRSLLINFKSIKESMWTAISNGVDMRGVRGLSGISFPGVQPIRK